MQRPMIATISRSVHCSVLAAVVLLLAAPGTLPAQSGSVIVEHSRVYVFVAKKGAGHDHGVEGLLAAGDLHFDRPQQAGGLTFDLKTLAADTSRARKFFRMDGETDADTQAAVNANMHGSAVLDVAKFPAAEFVVTQVQPLPPTQGEAGRSFQLDGELTLHGVKKSIRFTALTEQVNGMTRVRGRFALKQTDFGIKPFSKFLGAVGIADELQVYGDLWLRP